MIELLLGDTWHSDGYLLFLQSSNVIAVACIGAVICIALLLRKRMNQKYWIHESLCLLIALFVVVLFKSTLCQRNGVAQWSKTLVAAE